MQVLAYDIRPHPLLAEVLGFSYVPLPDLLAQADIISLHVPATPETYHLIDREKLTLVKPGGVA
ncbi:MAG: hypothetical protein KatS3mg061_2242 [Dehalococcoidia bacterium]|nr:MAG: hypothetical protein KatS3mg061_2242 [Dehalococcoidia bacterium]